MSEQVVVVTGATGGLGSVLVSRLSEQGKRLVCVDRSAAESALAQQTKALKQALPAAFELTSTGDWQRARGLWQKQWGPAGGAVLVAGGWRGGRRFFEDDDADRTWDSMLESNLETARVALRTLLPDMVQAGHGSIVVIGSRAAVRPWESARAAAYAASKAALVALVQTLAEEVRNEGVRLNAVLPSTLDTPVNRKSMPDADASRWVSLDSLCGVIEFLLSDAARDISGAAIPVYGRA